MRVIEAINAKARAYRQDAAASSGRRYNTKNTPLHLCGWCGEEIKSPQLLPFGRYYHLTLHSNKTLICENCSEALAPYYGNWGGWFSGSFFSKNAEFYDSDEWINLRTSHLIKYPFCMACGRDGNVVHHIKPISKYPELRLEPTNLITFCSYEHHLHFGHVGSWCRINKDLVYEDNFNVLGTYK